jgi:hypothetical protein
MEFTAHPVDRPNDIVYMGGEAPVGETLHFRIDLKQLQYPSRVFILQNGLYHEMVELRDVAGDQVVEFEETPTRPCYFRIEVHAIPAYEESYLRAREWRTVRLLSNPIYVGKLRP